MKTPRILTAIGLGLSLFATPLPAAPAPLTADEAKEIAVNAYIYAYPMVLMEATRRVISNAASRCASRADWLEYADWWNPILAEPLRVEKGVAIVGDGTGTGVDWNEDAVRRLQPDT
jgi:L-alanine-DL-glutamate epimerase-like enolase superfamily enzyme